MYSYMYNLSNKTNTKKFTPLCTFTLWGTYVQNSKTDEIMETTIL